MEETTTWAELQKLIQREMQDQPRGYQTRLAEQLGATRGFVNQLATGRRDIPVEHMDAVLESLGLELVVRRK